MKRKILTLLGCLSIFVLLTSETCHNEAVSTSGIKKASTKISVDLNGNSIEQNAIIERLKEDNKPGSIKHLYVISAYSGQVIMYSTVKGKVTSSGKRLSPSVANSSNGGFVFDTHNGSNLYTNEMLSDDGTYGSSVEYIYWWDSKNFYHQQFVTGGMILHISNQPLAVKNITINMELSTNTAN